MSTWHVVFLCHVSVVDGFMDRLFVGQLFMHWKLVQLSRIHSYYPVPTLHQMIHTQSQIRMIWFVIYVLGLAFCGTFFCVVFKASFVLTFYATNFSRSNMQKKLHCNLYFEGCFLSQDFSRDRILGCKSYELSSGYPQSPLLTDFTPLPSLSKSSLKLVCNINTVCGNLKSENSQDYAQKKTSTNCTFMNSASGLAVSLSPFVLGFCHPTCKFLLCCIIRIYFCPFLFPALKLRQYTYTCICKWVPVKIYRTGQFTDKESELSPAGRKTERTQRYLWPDVSYSYIALYTRLKGCF